MVAVTLSREDNLETRIAEVAKRALSLAAPLVRSVANGDLCHAALLRFFTGAITVQGDFKFVVEQFFRGTMCENLFLQARISTFTPRPNVVFFTTAFYCSIFRSVKEFNASISEKRGFVYELEPYNVVYVNVLVEGTSMFEHIPNMILPIYFASHWGYVILIPDLDRGGAVIMWGNSLGYSPPSGLLETVRLYLVLLYRGARFVVSSQNHALDVLGLARQKDGFSCGFYVLDVMSRFATGCSDDLLPVIGFEKYDRTTTEAYRDICIRSYVLHVLCIATSNPESVKIGLVDISESLNSEARKLREAANAGFQNMYPEMDLDKSLLLRRKYCCERLEGIVTIGENGNEHFPEGLMSKLYVGDQTPPLISTLLIERGVVSLSFGDIVDLDTIWNPTDIEMRNTTSLVSPALQQAAVEICQIGLGNAAQNAIASSTRLEGDKLPHAGSLPVSAMCNEAVPESMGVKAKDAGLMKIVNEEEACHNIFAYLGRRLSEGHLLRKPEYHELKGGDFRFRLRLRCRFYDPPTSYNGKVESYQRCQVRLYARLLRNDGGWRVSFRSRHNHTIWERSRVRTLN